MQINEKDLVFLVVADSGYKRNYQLGFLKEIRESFLGNYKEEEWKEAIAFGFSEFGSRAGQLMVVLDEMDGHWEVWENRKNTMRKLKGKKKMLINWSSLLKSGRSSSKI